MSRKSRVKGSGKKKTSSRPSRQPREPEANWLSGSFGFIKKFWLGILFLITLSSTIYNFFKIIQGQIGSFGLIILIISLISLWLICFYFRFGHFFKVTQKPSTPALRTIGIIGVVIIPLLALSGWGGLKWYQTLPPNKVIILVADFDGPEAKNYRVTENILRQLKDACHDYNDMEVKALEDNITEQQGSKKAKEKGQELRASIIIWGSYGVTK